MLDNVDDSMGQSNSADQDWQLADHIGTKPEEFTPDDIESLSDTDGVSEMLDLPYSSVLVDLFTPQSRAMVIDAFLSCGRQPTTTAELCETHSEVSEDILDRNLEILSDKYHIIRDLGEFSGERMYQLNTNNPITQLIIMLDEVYQNGESRPWLDSRFVH